jgi:hypothetical protein
MTPTIASLYRTAQATLGCAHFASGTYVAVRFTHRADTGTLWFDVSADGQQWVPYPASHLDWFTL